MILCSPAPEDKESNDARDDHGRVRHELNKHRLGVWGFVVFLNPKPKRFRRFGLFKGSNRDAARVTVRVTATRFPNGSGYGDSGFGSLQVK